MASQGRTLLLQYSRFSAYKLYAINRAYHMIYGVLNLINSNNQFARVY